MNDFKDDSIIMRTIRENVSKRIGFRNKVLSYKELKMIYRGCSFGLAIHNDETWCKLFTDDELKSLEYFEDLDDFYCDAYGRNINTKAPSVLIKDLVDKINQTISGDNHQQEKTTFLRFSHAGSIKQLVSHLGLFTTFTHRFDQNSYLGKSCAPDAQQSSEAGFSDYSWRSSLIAPFSAHFDFVLYKCSKDQGNMNPLSKYFIATFLQETAVKVFGCPTYLCPVSDFIDYHKQHSYDLNTLCKI